MTGILSENKSELTIPKLRAHALTFIIAGSRTTGHSLTSTSY